MNRISDDFFLAPEDNSLVGKLVVASPKISRGMAMSETVVLILQQNQHGIFGVVLNRPAPNEAIEAWQKVSGALGWQPLVAGGPMSGPVLALHQQPELAELEVDGGLYVSVQKDSIARLGKADYLSGKLPYRIVLGAVNWKGASLPAEIEGEQWYVMDSNPDLVFSEPTNMWLRCIQACGRETFSQVTGVRNFPANPLLNLSLIHI